MSDDQEPEGAPSQRDYTIKEAAGILGMRDGTLRRRVERGMVKALVGERSGRAIQVIPHDEFLRLQAEEQADSARKTGRVPPGSGEGGERSPGVVRSVPRDPEGSIAGAVMVRELRKLAEELGATRALVASTEERERAEKARAAAAESELLQARAEALAAQQRVQAAEAARTEAEAAAAAAREDAERARAEAEKARAEAVSRPGFWARLFGGGAPPSPPTAT